MDAPFELPDPRLQARLLAHVDVEEKIPRALEQLGPVADRRVLLLGAHGDGFRARQLEVMGARVTVAGEATGSGEGPRTADGPFDVAIALWPGTHLEGRPDRDAAPLSVAVLLDAERRVARGGRLLVVEDYGRDEVAALWSDPAREARLMAWSRRDGPLLGAGFRVHVLHCWWTCPDLEQARELLAAAFPAGAAVVATLKRPRLSHKVAVYHRAAHRAVAAA